MSKDTVEGGLMMVETLARLPENVTELLELEACQAIEDVMALNGEEQVIQDLGQAALNALNAVKNAEEEARLREEEARRRREAEERRKREEEERRRREEEERLRMEAEMLAALEAMRAQVRFVNYMPHVHPTGVLASPSSTSSGIPAHTFTSVCLCARLCARLFLTFIYIYVYVRWCMQEENAAELTRLSEHMVCYDLLPLDTL